MKHALLLISVFVVTSQSFSQNVGVGTATPLASLDVLAGGATSTTNGFMVRNSNGDTLFRLRNDGRFGFGYNASSYQRTMSLGGTGINFYTASERAFGGAVFPTDSSLIIWSNNGVNNYVAIQPDWGNCGIGTYTPNAKLHVNGRMLIGNTSAGIATNYELSVDGEIMCENLTMQPSGNWPDYVFEDNYPLMSITDLETSIRKNKHLPNVPSAADIEREGVNLGKVTKALLEKVEELTLYVIQLEKRLKAVEK